MNNKLHPFILEDSLALLFSKVLRQFGIPYIVVILSIFGGTLFKDISKYSKLCNVSTQKLALETAIFVSTRGQLS